MVRLLFYLVKFGYIFKLLSTRAYIRIGEYNARLTGFLENVNFEKSFSEIASVVKI